MLDEDLLARLVHEEVKAEGLSAFSPRCADTLAGPRGCDRLSVSTPIRRCGSAKAFEGWRPGSWLEE